MKFLALLLFLPVIGFSQIQFKHISLKEAKALAKEQNKPIFVDVFATWCGPCKYMANTTFQDSLIGNYFNREFINVKIDGEKADGPSIMSEYGITAYPTLLFISPKGELIERFVGAAETKTLRRLGIKTAHPDQDPVNNASKKYFASKKKETDLRDYILVLNENGEDSTAFYAEQYLKNVKSLDFSNEADRIVFAKGEKNPFSSFSDQFLASIALFTPKDAHDAMVRLILETFDAEMNSGSFGKTELVIRKFYPHLKQLNLVGLPTEDELVNEFKMQFDAEHGN